MKVCVASLNDMLSGLFDLSKLDAGVVTTEVSDFSLAEILATLAAVHAPGARAKGLSFRCIPTTLMVRTDPVLCARVVGNLLANAVRYTERGGVLIACRRRQGRVRVEVWDTGIGIAADKTGEIFEEFRQLANAFRDPSKGSGLGLAIAAKTAALLGLEIEVRSRPGRGSMFAVTMPRGQPIPPVAKREGSSRPLRIALAEDDPRVAQVLDLALSSMGHQVVSGSCGRDLLAHLGGVAPDIIISDYRLPLAETGLDVVASLRNRFGAGLPALVITGDTDPQLLQKMAAERIFIKHKPIGIDALQAGIAELVASAAVT